MKRLTFLLVLIAGFSLVAEERVTCETDLGTCEFTKTSSMCECTDSAYGEGTVSVSPDETALPTTEECEAAIKEQCGLPEGAEQCDNPAGKCVVFEDGTYYCNCLDGNSEGSGGSSGGSTGDDDDTPSVDPDEEGEGETEVDPVVEDEDGEKTNPIGDPDGEDDDPVEPQDECETSADCKEGECIDGFCHFVAEKPVCAEKLVEVCGTEAPLLSDYCTTESLPYCVDLFDLYSDKCNDGEMTDAEKKELIAGGWNEYASTVAHCCEEVEDADTKKEMEEMRTCLEAKSCEDCVEQVEPVYGEEEGKGDNGDSADTSGEEGGVDQGDTADAADERQQVSNGCSALIL